MKPPTKITIILAIITGTTLAYYIALLILMNYATNWNGKTNIRNSQHSTEQSYLKQWA